MTAALLPLPFLQKSASVLRKIFFVLHSKMIQEGLFRHEVFIVDVIFELLAEILSRSSYEDCIKR